MKPVSVKLSPEQREWLEKQAEAHGLNLSGYIRMMALKGWKQ